MTTIDEISSTEALDALRADWAELQAESAPDNVFLTAEWALAWWRHLGGGRRLRVLALREEGRVRAIVPLVEAPLGRRPALFRRLQTLGTGLSDRLDWLVSGDPRPRVERALSHLLQSPRSWTVVELRELREQSPTIEAVRSACARLGLRVDVAPDSESPYLAIESDWETFFQARFGRERRQQMRRKARRLEETAQPSFSVVEHAGTVGAALERLTTIQQHDSYQGEQRNSIFASAAKRAFFAAVAADFARRGWLRLGVLDLAGRPAAFRFAFEYAGTYYDYYHGYDHSFSAQSPGQALLGHTMQECFRRGLREVDFLRGNEAWKAVWTDSRRRHLRVRVFRPGWRGSVLRVLLAANDRRIKRGRRASVPPALTQA